MAYITIETDTGGGFRTLHESLSCDDLDNQVFSAHLIERLRWAVEDTATPPRKSAAATSATLSSGIPDVPNPAATKGIRR
jgi:hypothetical protein